MIENGLSTICADIRKFCKPKKVKWYCIGWRNGHRVWITESALRLATVDEICSDKSLEPAPLKFRRNRRFRR